MPSIFDMYAAQAFITQLREVTKGTKTKVGIVGMRVDTRTIAADKLKEFVQTLGLPVLTYLRDTQNYVHLAARGLSLFDVGPGRVEKDLEQWKPLCDWLEA